MSEWSNRLEVVLVEQEKRAAFDIHEYATEVLEETGGILKQRGVDVEKGLRRSSRASAAATAANMDDEEAEGEGEMVLAFDDIADGKDRAEVCRYFLSCLQLANYGNIEVIPPAASRPVSSSSVSVAAESAGEFTGGFNLRLLSMDKNMMIS